MAVHQLNKRLVLVADPMFATGGTFIATLDSLVQKGCNNIIGLLLVAEDLEKAFAKHPNIEIYFAAIDIYLDENVTLKQL